jgi:predicted homoserine dehydrogenase-like protein
VAGQSLVENRTVSVQVGVIGTGMIGADHIRRLSGAPTGAVVVAVADTDPYRAQRQAGLLREATGDDSSGVRAHPGCGDVLRPAAGSGWLHAPL